MSLVRKLDIPSRYAGPVFRAIEAILKEDPVLAMYVRNWRSREGQAGEMAVPSTDQMPLVGLSPVPNPSQVFDVDQQRVNFAVSVQLFVQGTCFEDISGLWEAIEDAIQDDKPFRGTTVARYLCGIIKEPAPAGAMRLRSLDPAFYAVDYSKPPRQVTSQRGEGTLTCFFLRPNRQRTP